MTPKTDEDGYRMAARLTLHFGPDGPQDWEISQVADWLAYEARELRRRHEEGVIGIEYRAFQYLKPRQTLTEHTTTGA